jgi:hypothetical protein
MTESAVLSDAALGDLSAILPGAALADATGGAIGPDPDAKPAPRQEPRELERPLPPERELPTPTFAWKPQHIGVTVRCADAGLEGYANFGNLRQRISPGVIQVQAGGRFRIEVLYHVDADNVPRPLPFQPPRVGLQFFFTPDGGDPSDTSVFYDPAPGYRGPGARLTTNFDQNVSFVVPETGWLTLSARIEDAAGAAEFDDTIRLLVLNK